MPPCRPTAIEVARGAAAAITAGASALSGGRRSSQAPGPGRSVRCHAPAGARTGRVDRCSSRACATSRSGRCRGFQAYWWWSSARAGQGQPFTWLDSPRSEPARRTRRRGSYSARYMQRGSASFQLLHRIRAAVGLNCTGVRWNSQRPSATFELGVADAEGVTGEPAARGLRPRRSGGLAWRAGRSGAGCRPGQRHAVAGSRVPLGQGTGSRRPRGTGHFLGAIDRQRAGTKALGSISVGPATGCTTQVARGSSPSAPRRRRGPGYVGGITQSGIMGQAQEVVERAQPAWQRTVGAGGRQAARPLRTSR